MLMLLSVSLIYKHWHSLPIFGTTEAILQIQYAMRETKNNPLRGHELDFVTVFSNFLTIPYC